MVRGRSPVSAGSRSALRTPARSCVASAATARAAPACTRSASRRTARSGTCSGHNENVSSISVAELDILVDAAEGLTTNESAARRHKGRETVKTQRKNILVKLGARNMTQAVAIAFDSDVIVARMAA
jgi:DNA-binding NarL/FixJ family response regulator